MHLTVNVGRETEHAICERARDGAHGCDVARGAAACLIDSRLQGGSAALKSQAGNGKLGGYLALPTSRSTQMLRFRSQRHSGQVIHEFRKVLVDSPNASLAQMKRLRESSGVPQLVEQALRYSKCIGGLGIRQEDPVHLRLPLTEGATMIPNSGANAFDQSHQSSPLIGESGISPG